MFTHFLDRLAHDVRVRSGVPLPVPEELAECRSTRKEGVIRSWAWSLPGIRRLRATRLDAGNVLQVF
ncbi:MAG: dihydrobiliverdin:ferredoxin oxidoreductase, partial [Cyanobacteria bacterium MAG APA_bin_95]|nr:dihydrobiliverdin:ferredoxin oxidoreductase [Cyanobacteria bacterium MAG APA_bin_95]